MNQEELKKFREYSLKARTIKMILPSGFTFDFILPTVGRLLKFSSGEQTADELMKLLQEGFPEEVDIGELPLTDFVYLKEVLSNFFEETQKQKESKSPIGSKNTQEGL